MERPMSLDQNTQVALESLRVLETGDTAVVMILTAISLMMGAY